MPESTDSHQKHIMEKHIREKHDKHNKNYKHDKHDKHQHEKHNHDKHKKCHKYHKNIPHISHIEPTSGPRYCANLFIHGDNLSKITSVNAGNMIITNFVIVSDNEIKVHIHEMPWRETGNNILITVSNCEYVSNSVFFNIIDEPIITSLDPSSGPVNSLVNITLNGLNLATTKSIIINNCAIDALNSDFILTISDTIVSFILPLKFNNQTIAISLVTTGGISNIVYYTGVAMPMI